MDCFHVIAAIEITFLISFLGIIFFSWYEMTLESMQ